MTTPNADVPSRPVLPIDALLNRIKAEYTELPGLQLTGLQAQRLWGLEAIQCDALLDALVDTAFLHRTKNGSYIRMSESF
jgi:hypothetical protein